MELIREKVAELCHKQWSGWMQYLFSKCEQTHTDQNGLAIFIPLWAVERWKRQMKTEYSCLASDEKEIDKKEADKFIKLFKSLEKYNFRK